MHNIWNYFYFLAYLKIKPQLEYSGSESYVASMIKNQDNSWFPSVAFLDEKVTANTHHP